MTDLIERLEKEGGSRDMPSPEEFRRHLKRGSLKGAWWKGEISESLLLQELARLEKVDGKKVTIPFPISAIALLRALEDKDHA
ncbi:MAG: hypothetical protein CL583_13480 [Alteromonadaceae bacterium]|nr:hypothetical protein [Alteromonadaceae bacterium]|tara:strand:- start:1645 stop:1893 length:249 start_codon:yes stop_codon:yes gene_type:complete